MQLIFQLHQEFIHHAQNDVFIQSFERDNRVQTIAKLRAERALDVLAVVLANRSLGEAECVCLHRARARIGRHNDDDIAKIRRTPVVIRQRAVIHHLQ